MAIVLGHVPRSVGFAEAFREDLRGIPSRGEYARILEPYRERFGTDLKIVLFDDIAADPKRFVENCAGFLSPRAEVDATKMIQRKIAAGVNFDIGLDDVAQSVRHHYRDFDLALASMVDFEIPWIQNDMAA